MWHVDRARNRAKGGWIDRRRLSHTSKRAAQCSTGVAEIQNPRAVTLGHNRPQPGAHWLARGQRRCGCQASLGLLARSSQAGLQASPGTFTKSANTPNLAHTTPLAPPAVGVYRTWTVSTCLFHSLFAPFACTNSPMSPCSRARASPSPPSPSRVKPSRNPSAAPSTALCRVPVASTRPLSPFAVPPGPPRPRPLRRSHSIRRPSRIDICHRTSIARLSSNVPTRFVGDRSRVVLRFPTHPLSPTCDHR